MRRFELFHRRCLSSLVALLPGCGVNVGSVGVLSAGQTSAGSTDGIGSTTDAAGDQGVGELGGSADSSGGGFKFDTVSPDVSRPSECQVADDMNAIGVCETAAPPDSFTPVLQWTYTDPEEPTSVNLPLVANFTDDNEDGAIDLCDVPDVVLLTHDNLAAWDWQSGHIRVLSGDTGALHFRSDVLVSWMVNPAVGDIDGDGFVEIATIDVDGRLVALSHTGELEWASAPPPWVELFDEFQHFLGASLGLADLDNDGDVEIYVANMVFDHQGQLLHAFTTGLQPSSATVAADLDGDDDLELVLGHAAHHHDGTLAWDTGLAPGFPQIADLDGDGLPEVLLTNDNGLSLIEHDGVVTYAELRPLAVPPGLYQWGRPAGIHDIDGDGVPEIMSATDVTYSAFRPDASVVWTTTVDDPSGLSAGTAFDFLGSGRAQAVYADEYNLFAYDSAGQLLMQGVRRSRTNTEYPVIADVDNDGSAEILVVSSVTGEPALKVFRDADDRWIQARRIWNQHAYHVTNVREDGSIPTHQPRSWEALNTFRTNAQIEGGALCMPEPVG